MSLYNPRNRIEKYIREDVNVIRHEFEGRSVAKLAWISGRHNFADTGINPDSALKQSLKSTLYDGRLEISFQTVYYCSAEQFLG